MLRKCCEFCEYYEADYDLKCSSCRFEDDEACNYSNFEVSKELIEWVESVKLDNELCKQMKKELKKIRKNETLKQKENIRDAYGNFKPF